MKFSEYETYFLEAAKSNKKISHLASPDKKTFRRIDIEEVITGAKSSMKGLSMFLEAPEIGTRDMLSDNPRKLFEGAFLILNEAAKGNFDSEMTVLDETMDVAEQVVAKMKNDLLKHKLNANHPYKIKGFDPSSVKMFKVGPVFGNWYGWRVSFTIDQTWSNRLTLNNNDWFFDTKATI